VLFTGFLQDVEASSVVGVACGEVGGPVLAGVGDPADGGVDVDAEEVGEDCGGQVGGERGEGSVAGGPGADAVAVELVVEAVEVQRLAGDAARDSQRGVSGPLGIMRRGGGCAASSPRIAPRRGGTRTGRRPAVR
jgi:hypothetical protein